MKDSIRYVIGMDLSDRKADYFAAERASGALWQRGQLGLSQEGLAGFFGSLAASWVVIETGTHSRWVKEALEELGHEVTVADARQLRLIFGGRHKTDQLDAKALCDLALLRPSLLHPVELRGEQLQRDLAVVRNRDAIVRARSLLANNIRGTVKTLGGRIRSCEPDYLSRWAGVDLEADLYELVRPLLEAVEALSTAIATQEGRIRDLIEQR